MNKKKAKVSVERGVISRLLAKAGYKKLSDVKMNALAHGNHGQRAIP